MTSKEGFSNLVGDVFFVSLEIGREKKRKSEIEKVQMESND